MPKSPTRETLLLLDAHGLVYRAFYALPYFTTKDGQPTNAVYGFTTMLLKVLEETAPQYVAAAFDKPGPTFRHEAFAAYKATRTKMPDDLRPQIALAKEVVEAFDLPIFEVAGFEADDILGTLARLANARGLDVVIVTGDLDALQLVSPHVRVMVTSRGISETVTYDADAVRAKLGVAPHQVPDLKSLKGDASDNIPGVPGIGDKTAARLLPDGASVEQVLDRLEDLRDARLRQRLREHRDQVLQSKALSTIQTDVPLEVSWDVLRRPPLDAARLRALFTRLEFKTLIDRLGVAAPRTEIHGAYRTLTAADVPSFLRDAAQLAIVTVADDARARTSGLTGIAGRVPRGRGRLSCRARSASPGARRGAGTRGPSEAQRRQQAGPASTGGRRGAAARRCVRRRLGILRDRPGKTDPHVGERRVGVSWVAPARGRGRGLARARSWTVRARVRGSRSPRASAGGHGGAAARP